MVQMQMEYRPMGDVLSGSVPSDAPLEKRHHAELDADTFVEWAPDHVGGRRLVSFRMLHARTRTTDDPSLDRLPEPIKRGALEFFRTMSDSPAAKSLASPDEIDLGVLALPTIEFTLSDVAPMRGSSLDAEMLADEFRRLAEVMSDLPGKVDESRMQSFIYSLSELASALDLSDGLAAPGAAAAVRAAVRGGVALTSGERAELLRLLDRLDDPVAWHGLSAELEAFIDRLEPGATITE